MVGPTLSLTAHRIGASASTTPPIGRGAPRTRKRRRARISGRRLRVPEDVRSISYFPALGGWTLMWTRFDAKAIDRDLARSRGFARTRFV